MTPAGAAPAAGGKRGACIPGLRGAALARMATNLTVRPTVPADLAAVDALLARSYARQLRADYAPSLIVMALPALSRARPALVASGRYYLAEAPDGAVLGVGGWSKPGATGEVRHLVTDYRHLRQGVARAIMARILSDLETAGVARLECLATRTAVPFYLATGFRIVGPVTIALAPGIEFPVIRMQRAVARPGPENERGRE